MSNKILSAPAFDFTTTTFASWTTSFDDKQTQATTLNVQMLEQPTFVSTLIKHHTSLLFRPSSCGPTENESQTAEEELCVSVFSCWFFICVKNIFPISHVFSMLRFFAASAGNGLICFAQPSWSDLPCLGWRSRSFVSLFLCRRV